MQVCNIAFGIIEEEQQSAHFKGMNILMSCNICSAKACFVCATQRSILYSPISHQRPLVDILSFIKRTFSHRITKPTRRAGNQPLLNQWRMQRSMGRPKPTTLKEKFRA
jgi:hypothetical protein